MGLLASGALSLEFTTDYRAFFRSDNPRLQAFEGFQDTYGKDDNVLFVLESADGRVFTRRTLGAVEELTRRAWRIPHARRVDSLTNFTYSRARGDTLEVDDLVRDAAGLDDQALQEIRDVAIHDPRLVGRLVDREGRVTGVNVTIELPDREPRRAIPVVAAAARELASDMQARYPEITLHLTGISIMDDALTRIPMTDMLRLMPLVFTVIFGVMVGMLRRPLLVGAAFAVVFCAIGVAMGLAGWYGVVLTPPSAVSPIIILTLAVADATHIVVNYASALGEGRTREAALEHSFRLNLRAVTLTSLTTALGFLGLNLSASPPFQHLGNLVAVGVVAAYLLTVLFLPALLLCLPVPRPRAGRLGSDRLVSWVAHGVVSHHRALLWGMGLATLTLVLFIPRNQLNDMFVNYFSPEVDFRRATEFTTENLTGLYLLEYELDAGASGAIAELAFLDTLSGFTAWLRDQPEVMHVASLSDTLRHLNRNLHGDAAGAYRLPASRDLAAQYLLLYELSLPYGRDLTDRYNLDKSATRLTAALRPLSSNHLLDLERRADAWLAGQPGVEGFTATGAPLMFAYVGSDNIRGNLTGTTLALIGISLLMIWALGSVKLGLISLIPNLAPAAMAFGVWGLLVGEVGMALSSVISMTLGIVVNDSIHFLSKYQAARREQGADPAQAIGYAFATVGTALWVTSLVLVLGFCVLLFSEFVPNAGMGLLTAITIAFALAADFLLLPPLLIWLDNAP